MQRFFIWLAGTVIRLRSMVSVLAGAVGIAVVGVVAVVVIAAIFRALNFGNDVGLLVSLFLGALGALHTLFCHSYHLGISVASGAVKNTRKNFDYFAAEAGLSPTILILVYSVNVGQGRAPAVKKPYLFIIFGTYDCHLR